MKRMQPFSRSWRRSHRIDLGLAAGLLVAWAIGLAIVIRLAP